LLFLVWIQPFNILDHHNRSREGMESNQEKQRNQAHDNIDEQGLLLELGTKIDALALLACFLTR
jgi:hypothetical protein